MDYRIMDRKALIVAAIIIFLLILPLKASAYWIRFLTALFMYATLSQAWNIIGGFAGYASFGNVVFFGLGSYITAAFMNNYNLSFPVSFIFSGLIPMLFAVFVGLPVLRLRGHYFAIATLGVAEATREIISNIEFFGGGLGISLPIARNFLVFYYIMFFLMFASTLSVYALSKSRLGYGLVAIRENEDAAEVLGINSAYYKTIAFALSALFTGLAGGVYAYWITYIDPPSVFDVSITVKMVIMTVLGGAGTIFGPIAGALILQGISEILWREFLYVHSAALGIFIIIIVILLPRGFMPFIKGEKPLRLSLILENIREHRA